MSVLLPGKGPKFLRLRGFRPSKPTVQASRVVLYASASSGSSGNPTADTMRIGETISVHVITLDEFGVAGAGNRLTLSSSNTSVFTVIQTATDAENGTATATITANASGTAFLLQASLSWGTSLPQATAPVQVMAVTVLDASGFVFAAGTLQPTPEPIATHDFDESSGRVTVRADAFEDPVIAIMAIPVDSRHVVESAEPSYGVSDVTWTSATGAVLFVGTTGMQTSPFSGLLDVFMIPTVAAVYALGGDELVTVTATNSLGATITGTISVRVLLATTVRATES